MILALRCGLALFSECLVPLHVGALLVPDPFEGPVLTMNLIRGGQALLLHELDPLLAHLLISLLLLEVLVLVLVLVLKLLSIICY